MKLLELHGLRFETIKPHAYKETIAEILKNGLVLQSGQAKDLFRYLTDAKAKVFPSRNYWARIASKVTKLIVARDSGKIVGWVLWFNNGSKWRFTDPTKRQQGIGSKLLVAS